jgi:hypothetical protein
LNAVSGSNFYSIELARYCWDGKFTLSNPLVISCAWASTSAGKGKDAFGCLSRLRAFEVVKAEFLAVLVVLAGCGIGTG